MNVIHNFSAIEWRNYIAEIINVLVYGSGVNVRISGTVIPALGMMWFFLALFLGRTFFDYLHLKLDRKAFIVSLCICTLLGIGFGYVQWLPLSLDIALAVMPFFMFGNNLKKVNLSNKQILVGASISFVAWICSFAPIYSLRHSYMELVVRRYPLFRLAIFLLLPVPCL